MSLLDEKWSEFWEVFWHFGHTTAELAWSGIEFAVFALIASAWAKAHDRKHHHHTDHSGDAK